MNNNDISMKFENKVTGEKKLERYAQQLTIIKNAIQSMPKSFSLGGDTDKKLEKTNQLLVNLNKNMSSFKRSTTSALGNMSKVFNETSNATKKLVDNANALNGSTKQAGKGIKDLGDKLNTAINVGSLVTYIKSFGRFIQTLSKFTNVSSAYLENLNLMNVAFGNTKEKVQQANNEALKFVNTLSEMYGLDESEVVKAVGTFKNLANAMQLSDDVGTKLSKTLTQLSIDVSSLYNIDFDDAMSKIQSALAGQTKPVRFLGADITQATLQVTLDSYGIDRTVTSLSYAEKRLLIVTSLLNQLNASQNDYGKTVENTANQMRVFDQQLQRLSRAIGNVFMPILAKVLPYMNAVLMVLVEIINYIAMLLGFKEEKFDVFADIETDIGGLEDSLDSAGESAKKLKQGLRGFDKLNVINTPSSGGSGGISAGGVDVGIMNALNQATEEYEKKLQSIRMKATDIRNKIMEWLGFTELTDEEGNHLGFTFDHITSGTVLGALAVGGVIYSGVHRIYKVLKSLGLLDFGNITKTLGKLNNPLGIAGLAAIKIGIDFTSVWGQIDKFKESLEKGDLGSFFKIDSIDDLIGKVTSLTFLIQGGLVPTIVMAIIQFKDEIGKFISETWNSIVEFFNGIWTWFDETIIQPIVKWLEGIAETVYNTAIKPIIDFFTPIYNAFKETIEKIWNKITEIYEGVKRAIGTIIDKIVEIAQAIWKAINDYVIEPIKKKIEEIWNDIATFFGDIFKNIQQIWDNFYKTVIQPIVNLFSNVGQWIYEKIIDPVIKKLEWLRDKAIEIFKKVSTGVIDFISGTFKSVINGVLWAIESAINGFIRLLNKAITLINKIPGVDIAPVGLLSIPRLKVGMDFVPNDYYPAYLDYGERVLTKEQNADYNRGIINGKVATNSQPINATFVIQVGSQEVAREVLTNLQDMAKSNGKPITIGG